MLKKLLQLLVCFMVLGVVDGDGAGDDTAAGGDGDDTASGAGGEDTAGAGDDTLPDDDLDSLIETVEGTGDEGDRGAGGRENAAIRDARRRAQESEEARIRAEATLDAERRLRATPTTTDDQRLYEQEEARLRDPETQEIEKWQIRSNRTLRANTQAATRALTTAADMQDKNAFDRLEITNPKVYKLYSSKVEKSLAEMRAKGQDAPRLALLRFMIGNDVMEGKLKGGTTKKAPAAAARTDGQGVNRGRVPGARSDVSGKGRMTDHEKRRERLKNVII